VADRDLDLTSIRHFDDGIYLPISRRQFDRICFEVRDGHGDPNARPWDQPFLPPAPAWDGASRALLRPASDPWASAFEQDPAHDFSPDYADTRAWFERLDKAPPT
jgi:hypothetical protein